MGFQEEVFATSATLRRPTSCARRPIGQFSPVLLHLPTSGVREALGRSGVLGEGHWAAIRHLGRETSNASRSDALASAAMPSSTRKTGSSARLRIEIAGIACPSPDQLHEPALGTSRGAGVSPDTRQRVATLVGWVRSPASACRRRGRNARPVALDLSGADCNRREAFIAGGTTSRTASASRPWRRPSANRGGCRDVVSGMDVDDVAGQHAHLCQGRRGMICPGHAPQEFGHRPLHHACQAAGGHPMMHRALTAAHHLMDRAKRRPATAGADPAPAPRRAARHADALPCRRFH